LLRPASKLNEIHFHMFKALQDHSFCADHSLCAAAAKREGEGEGRWEEGRPLLGGSLSLGALQHAMNTDLRSQSRSDSLLGHVGFFIPVDCTLK
jgi:hypothetical protein